MLIKCYLLFNYILVFQSMKLLNIMTVAQNVKETLCYLQYIYSGEISALYIKLIYYT